MEMSQGKSRQSLHHCNSEFIRSRRYNMSVNNSRTDSTGGIYTGTAYGDKTFYGSQMDHATGDCTVTVIDANDEDPITIDTIYPEIVGGSNDYKAPFLVLILLNLSLTAMDIPNEIFKLVRRIGININSILKDRTQ